MRKRKRMGIRSRKEEDRDMNRITKPKYKVGKCEPDKFIHSIIYKNRNKNRNATRKTNRNTNEIRGTRIRIF